MLLRNGCHMLAGTNVRGKEPEKKNEPTHLDFRREAGAVINHSSGICLRRRARYAEQNGKQEKDRTHR